MGIKGYIQKHSWTGVVARLVVGALFVFSSAAKAIDPYGTVLKMEEYFVAMGMEWLSGVATVMAVGLITVEMLLGVMLLLGAMPRLTSTVTLLFNGFYLLLTLWIAAEDPVADCGCFGDVVVLTNGQTLAKNMVLTLLAVVIFLRRKVERGALWRSGVSWGVGAATLGFTIYSLIMLPVVERFPFGVGVNLPQAIEQELIATADNTFVICRDLTTGKQHRFGVNDPAWWDGSRWEYIRTESPKEELKVRVSEFVISAGRRNLTEEILSMEVCHLLCAESVDDLSEKEKEKIRRIADECRASGARVFVISSSPLYKVQDMFPGLEFANMDPVVLRALLRAPAGAVMLQNGTIVYKASLARLKSPSGRPSDGGSEEK